MAKIARYLGQAILYIAFFGFIAYFSRSPAHVVTASGQAEIKLSFSHAGQRKQPCRQRSQEELQKLAPNMRVATDCPRERSSVRVALELDGQPLYQEMISPAGLAHDGMSSVYRRFVVPAGTHIMRLRLQDHETLPNSIYSRETHVTLAAGQVFTVGFDTRQGGFVLR